MKKEDALGKLFKEIMEGDGNVLCEKCSSAGSEMTWNIWHTPDNPCPREKENMPNTTGER
jgi:hypothetical protein